MKISVINGPNMNMLGIREPGIYGRNTYDDLCSFIRDSFPDIEFDFFQSNHEGALIDKIQQCYSVQDGIVINPAAYTHTSIAIADALKAVGIPYVEVHISDVAAREEYRQVSFTAEKALTVIAGKGFDGYIEAVKTLRDTVERN